jgi:predicted TIM-barrel fold metal-dependent hydrolase
MRQKAISADSHIDLSWMPPTLFVENASAEYRDRMPYVVDTPAGRRWVSKAGTNLGFSGGVGATGRKYVPGLSPRADAMAAEGLFSDAEKGILRLSDPHLRIKDQDRDGVDAEVLYGVLGISARLGDIDASVEMLRIYNEWLDHFCSAYPKRLLGLASVPSHSPEEAVTELKRLKNSRFIRGIDVSAAPPRTPYYHPEWIPFWQAVRELNLPVHFHTFGPEIIDTTGFDDASKEKARAAAFSGGQIFRACRIVMDLIMGCVLEDFPDVKIVLGEAGVGWIPYILDRMDMMWDEEFHRTLKLTRKPSEYWHRQCHVSFQTESSAGPVLHLTGYDNVMWASDFPHPDGLWPDSQKFIEAQFVGIPEEAKHKMIYGNAARLYGVE